MDRDTTDQVPQSTDPPVEGDTNEVADTEGHSMLTIELARTIASERVREGERMSRDASRARETLPDRSGGLLKRLGRR